jgi:hypothetical protein
MGSKGSKPRKPKHSQHLPKVGTTTENERLLHEERHAIGDVMGLGSSPVLRAVVIGIVALLFVSAVLSFLVWWR